MMVGRYRIIGFIFTPMHASSMMLLPPDKVHMSAGLINIMQQGIGRTIGLAMMTTLLEPHIQLSKASPVAYAMRTQRSERHAV